MQHVGPALWAALKDIWGEYPLLITCNVLWVLFSAPLLVAALFVLQDGAGLLAALFLLVGVLPMAPASAGLHHVAAAVARGEPSSVRAFFRAMLHQFVPACLLLGTWMAVFLTVLISIHFYTQIDSALGLALSILMRAVLIVWCALLVYLFPVLQLSDPPQAGWVARNVLVLVLGRAGFTFTTLLLMLVVLLGSLLLSFVFVALGPALLALWGMHATLRMLDDIHRVSDPPA